MSRIIGLTGGSGAGKTLVSMRFQALGAGAVDADAVYRQLCTENHAMLGALQAAFGDILTADGALDRPKLARMVFSNAEKLKQLNAITFPYIRAASEARFAELAEQGREIILYDAPTLFQTGADALCEDAIGVIASRETRVARIMERDKLTHAAACARIDSQPDADFYRARCRYIIRNDDTADQLNQQAEKVWGELLAYTGG